MEHFQKYFKSKNLPMKAVVAIICDDEPECNISLKTKVSQSLEITDNEVTPGELVCT